MIYSAAWGEADFTVPQFDLYLMRVEQIDKSLVLQKAPIEVWSLHLSVGFNGRKTRWGTCACRAIALDWL